MCLRLPMITRTLTLKRKREQEMRIGFGMLGYVLFLLSWKKEKKKEAKIQQLVGFVLAQGWPIQGLARPRQISWLITSEFCHNKQRSLGFVHSGDI